MNLETKVKILFTITCVTMFAGLVGMFVHEPQYEIKECRDHYGSRIIDSQCESEIMPRFAQISLFIMIFSFFGVILIIARGE